MNKPFLQIFLLCLIASFAVPGLSHAKIVDKIVAVVNSEVITQAEIDRVLYPLYLQYSKVYKDRQELYKRLDEVRLEILKQLISDKLILCEARRLEINVTQREVDTEFLNVKEDLKEKGMVIDDLLRQENLTLSDLREKYRDQIMIRKAIDQVISSKINIQPSQVNKYYSENIEDYSQAEQVAVYAILIRHKAERSPAETRKLAEDVLKMVRSGFSFKDIAKRYSEGAHSPDGGDFGYVRRREFLDRVDKAIFSLRVGEISDIIDTPTGYYIFKVYDRKNRKTLPLKEVRQKVIRTLYRAELQKRYQEWLEKLKANAYISIK